MNKITDTGSFERWAEEDGFDPIDKLVRVDVRATIAAVFEAALAAFAMIVAKAQRLLSTRASQTATHRHVCD